MSDEKKTAQQWLDGLRGESAAGSPRILGPAPLPGGKTDDEHDHERTAHRTARPRGDS